MVIVKRSLQHIVLEHSETRHVHAFPADLPAAVHQPIPTPANRRPILSSLIIGLVMLVVVGSLSFRAITVLYHPVVSSPGHPPVNSAPPSQIVPTQTVLTPAKLIHRPIVCVATYQVIRALRTSDGSQLWRYSTGHSIEGPAMVMQGDTLYAVSVDGHLYALQITTGKLLWQQLVGATPNFPADVGGGSLRIMAGDTVVAIGYDMRVPRKAVVYVFKAQNGAPLWHDQAQAFDQGRSLVGVDDTAVYITDTSLQGGSSVTLARLAMNGTLLWTSPHFIAPAAWAGTPSLVIVNGVLYGYGNDLLAIHAQNGQLLWEQKVSQDGFPAQITTGNNEVYLVTQHRFCAYRMNDGAQLWCTHTQPQQGYYSEEFEQTVFMNGIAYVGRGLWIPDGLRIEAWDANKGSLHWAWPANVSLLSHDLSWLFAGSNGILYVPVRQGIYAIRGSDGHQLWFATLNMGWGPIVPAP